MKKALVIPALLIVLAVVYLIQNHGNFGEALPPENAPNVLLIMIDDMGFRTMNSRCPSRVNSTGCPRSLRDSIL